MSDPTKPKDGDEPMPEEKDREGKVDDAVEEEKKTESAEKPSDEAPKVKKIREKTKAKAEAAQRAPKELRIKQRLDRFFKWAILISFLAHSPVIFGRGDKTKKFWEMGFMDFGGPGRGMIEAKEAEKKAAELEKKILDETPPTWEQEVKESLKKVLGEKDAEKVIDDVDPEALAGFKKAEEAVKKRKEERAGRIDKAKFEEYKKNLLERLEKGEKVLFRDFVFEMELLGLGIEASVVEEAKKIFMDEMRELEKTKPAVPTREYLKKIVGLSEQDEKNDAYEPTRTSLAEYLVRKKQGKRGNCVARGKYQSMALEYLYPERVNDILLQKGGDHIRALLDIAAKIHVMEPGVSVITKEDLKGTITFSLLEYMLSSAGKKIVKHVDKEKVEDKEKPKADLPTINDDTAFKDPEADGKLKNFSNNHQFLYKEKFQPPETEKMKLPPSSKEVHQRNEELRKQIAQQKEKAKRAMESEKKRGPVPPPPVADNVIEVADWVVELEDGKQKTPEGSWKPEDLSEILPWEQKDYPDIELVDRIQSGIFNGGEVYYGRNGKHESELVNPSPATIKKINAYAIDEARYDDHGLFGKKTWHEIFNSHVPRLAFRLNSARLSQDFENLLTSPTDDVARKYAGETSLHVGFDQGFYPELTDLHGAELRNKMKPAVEFPEAQFKALMQGEGGLSIFYPEKDFSEKEIAMIAQSSRPYVSLSGYVCNYESDALFKMNESKKTVLVLNDWVYFEVLHRNPHLLMVPKLRLDHEYFAGSEQHQSPVGKHGLINAYSLREILQAQPDSSDPSAIQGMELGKLNELIAIMEQKFISTYSAEHIEMGRKTLEELQEKARQHYALTGAGKPLGSHSPIGSMGVCLPPDNLAANYYVEQEGVIKKYEKPAPEQQPSSVRVNQPLHFNGSELTGDAGIEYSIRVSPIRGEYSLVIKSSTGSQVHRVLLDADGSYNVVGPGGEKSPLQPHIQQKFQQFAAAKNGK